MLRPPQKANVYGYLSTRSGVDAVTDSASVIVPLLREIFHPDSVLDIGCGTGDWLSVFQATGSRKICGYDGVWVPKDSMKIKSENFRTIDFYGDFSITERFDFALCLEVAEHVSREVSEKMVRVMCGCADVVLWSAAIPGQGGYEHINERYQDHWIEVFKAQGFTAFDLVRPKVWMNEKVSWWYQQNCLVFANAPACQKYSLTPEPFVPVLIHPLLYESARDPKNYSVSQIVRTVPHYLTRRFSTKKSKLARH